MNTVTFPEFAGGATFTDDSNPDTGMGAGGHRQRFIPSLAAVVTVAADVVEKHDAAVQAKNDAETAAATAAGYEASIGAAVVAAEGAAATADSAAAAAGVVLSNTEAAAAAAAQSAAAASGYKNSAETAKNDAAQSAGQADTAKTAAQAAQAAAAAIAAELQGVDGHATMTLTNAQVTSTIIDNVGQVGVANLQLPVAGPGMNFILCCGQTSAFAWRIRAALNDKICLDGVPGIDNGYVGISAPTIFNYLSVFSIKTGAGTYDWIAISGGGIWGVI